MLLPVFLLFFCWPFSLKEAGGLGGPKNEPTTKTNAGETGLKLQSLERPPNFSGSDRRRGAPSVPRLLCNATTPASCHPPMHWVPASPQAGGREQDFKVTQTCPWPPGASSPGEERFNANTSDLWGVGKDQVQVMWKKSQFLRQEMLALPKKKKKTKEGRGPTSKKPKTTPNRF